MSADDRPLPAPKGRPAHASQQRPAGVLCRSLGRSLCGLLALALAGPGCGRTDLDGDEGSALSADVGMIAFHLTSVPADVRCVRVTVQGVRTVSQMFPVTPGERETFTLAGIAAGVVTVQEEAFAVRCDDVGPATPPTWVNEQAISATVVARETVSVEITLRRTGSISVGTDFLESSLVIDQVGLDFGGVTMGGSRQLTLAVRNVGTVTTGAIGLAVAGPAAAEFNVSPAGCSSLDAGASCTVTILFTPGAPGPRSAGLVATAEPGGIATAALSGRGLTAALLASDPPAYDFGTVAAGTSSGGAAFVIRNVGQTPTGTVETAIAPTTTVFSTPYRFNADTCTGSTLAPGATCTVIVRADVPMVRADLVATADLLVRGGGGLSLRVPLRLTVVDP